MTELSGCRLPYHRFIQQEPLLCRGSPVPLKEALQLGLLPREMRTSGPGRAFRPLPNGQRLPRYHPEKYEYRQDGQLLYRGMGGHVAGKARGYVSMTKDLAIARGFSMGNPDGGSLNPKRGGVYVLKDVPAIDVNAVRKKEREVQRAAGFVGWLKASVFSAYKPGEYEFDSPEPVAPRHIVGYRSTRSKSMGYDRGFDPSAPIFIRRGLKPLERLHLINCLSRGEERRHGRRPALKFFDDHSGFSDDQPASLLSVLPDNNPVRAKDWYQK